MPASIHPEQHLCIKCYEVNKGFNVASNGAKTCCECGGKVLFLQEAADHIADLVSELRSRAGEDFEL